MLAELLLMHEFALVLLLPTIVYNTTVREAVAACSIALYCVNLACSISSALHITQIQSVQYHWLLALCDFNLRIFIEQLII